MCIDVVICAPGPAPPVKIPFLLLSSLLPPLPPSLSLSPLARGRPRRPPLRGLTAGRSRRPPAAGGADTAPAAPARPRRSGPSTATGIAPAVPRRRPDTAARARGGPRALGSRHRRRSAPPATAATRRARPAPVPTTRPPAPTGTTARTARSKGVPAMGSCHLCQGVGAGLGCSGILNPPRRSSEERGWVGMLEGWGWEKGWERNRNGHGNDELAMGIRMALGLGKSHSGSMPARCGKGHPARDAVPGWQPGITASHRMQDPKQMKTLCFTVRRVAQSKAGVM